MDINSLLLEKQKIIDQIQQIEDLQKAKLSEQYFVKINSQGREVKHGPYYNLQRWINGKNQTVRINRNQIEPYHKAIIGYETFKQLCDQFVDVCEQITLLRREAEQTSKKTPHRRIPTRRDPKVHNRIFGHSISRR